jgi:hypothetical protein
VSDDFTDFAGRKRRTLSGIVRNRFWLLAAFVTVAWLAWDAHRIRRELTAELRTEASHWDIKGPPCPVVGSANAAGRGRLANRTLEFHGATFGRRFGHVSCTVLGVKDTTLKGAYPACQFTAPAVVRVSINSKTYVFEPGVGHSATVWIPDGIPQCVVAAKFRG